MTHSETISAFYNRHGPAWVRARGNHLTETPWLTRFRALAPPAAPLLDLGCGAGRPLAQFFIRQGHPVTGIDASPGMIRLCQRDFPAQHWHVADMRALRLGRSFGLLLAWDSFFHLSPGDQRRMFPIFRDHAAPGAALMFTSGWSYGEAIGTLFGDPLYHASLDPAEYRAQLHANDFQVIDHVVRDAGCGDRTIWLARKR